MVEGALPRVTLGRMNVIFRNLFEYNLATNNIKGVCVPSTCVGNHILRKSPVPQSLLPIYSRRFSVGATNHNHISKDILRAGNHILPRSPLPQLLLPSYSRRFSIGGTNHNHISKDILRAGNHILRKSPLPQLLLPSYSRCFSIGGTNNHISKELSDESDSEPKFLYFFLDPHRFPPEVEELNDSDRGHCASKPLVQIFSASIHTDFGDENKGSCDIYGSIQATEEQGAKLNVYDRDQAHSEPMNFNHGNLTLNSPKGSYIACNVHYDTTLDVYIKDKTRDMVLVKGKHILHSKADEIEDSCDKLINAIIRSEHGFLSLYYTIFRFGVVASVAVKILKKTHDASSFFNVHGSIIAEYANSEKYCNTNDEVRYMKTTLFKKSADQPVQTLVDTDIELSRCAVVVPSYSTLKIQVQLSDSHGQFASGSAEFLPHHFALSKKRMEGERGSILVHVQWDHAYMPLTEVDTTDPTDCSSDEEDWPNWGHILMEIFSVYVDGLRSHSITALCGEIAYGDQLLYQRDLSDPELLMENKSIITSLNCNKPLNDNRMIGVPLYLVDPLLDIEVSNGHIAWSEVSLSAPMYNQRLCSVVPGMRGYAAVYYTIFDNACQALMGITFLSNYAPDVIANMYGCIVARYGDDYEDYTTNYEKKYFQSRLFDVSRAESVQLTTNSEIPLSKYIVAVPVDSSLVIEADLRSVVDQEDEAIVGVIKFDQVHLSHTYRKEIRGRNCCIEVFVKFKGARDAGN